MSRLSDADWGGQFLEVGSNATKQAPPRQIQPPQHVAIMRPYSDNVRTHNQWAHI